MDDPDNTVQIDTSDRTIDRLRHQHKVAKDRAVIGFACYLASVGLAWFFPVPPLIFLFYGLAAFFAFRSFGAHGTLGTRVLAIITLLPVLTLLVLAATGLVLNR